MRQPGVPLIFFALFALVGLAFTVFFDPYIRRGHRRTLMLIIGLCFSLVVQNYVEDWLAAGPPRVLARTLAAIYGYCVRPVIVVLFFSIVAPQKKAAPAWALVALNAGVHLTALFSPLCFWISGDNHYHGGPLANTCLAVSALLLMYLLYLTIREHSRAPRREIAFPVLIILMIFAAIWMDSQVGAAQQPISYLTAAMALSCVFYYIWLHMQFAREHEEDLKARQRIRIMMSQIQPHFLYNTLSTIQVLCHTDPEKAAETVQQFSLYLRQNLSALGQPGLIPFWKELDHTKTYVKIEETRFQNIRVKYDIRDKEFSLPPLTLQPLVENAIRYGVRIREEGIVEITAKRTEDAHEIVVRDNGAGFDVKTLADMDETHIGIRNVRQRLESMCGGTLLIESRMGAGTAVTIRIPIREETEKQGAQP